MFFKDTANFTKKQVYLLYLLFGLIYIGFTLIAPMIVIASKYELFITSEKVGKLSGFGIIIVLAFGVIGLRKLRHVVDEIPGTTMREMRFKAAIQAITSLFPYALAFFLLAAFKSNFDLAYETTKICLLFIMVGVVIDKLFFSFIERELIFRRKADELREINKR